MKSDKKYLIYFLVNDNKNHTYVGYTNNLKKRILKHESHSTKTTKYFQNFKVYILDRADNVKEARIKEKYWKSHAGRNKLKRFFEKIK